MQKLKVKFMRWVVGSVFRAYWRNKAPLVAKIEHHAIAVKGGDISADVYFPEGERLLPVIFYLHGGGFVVGSIAEYKPLMKDICAKSGRIVVAVDYRLAPEYPFPTAPEDCLAALHWLKDNIDRFNGDVSRVVVAGDSAGGNLAAVLAQQAQQSLPDFLAGQIMIYPATHHYSYNTSSYHEKGKGHGLTRNMMVWFWDTYLKNSPLEHYSDVVSDPMAAPLAATNLEGLPSALMITAEHDPLRDEGNEYAEKLVANGVEVQHSMYPGMEHGFIGVLGPTPDHQAGMKEIVEWLDAHV